MEELLGKVLLLLLALEQIHFTLGQQMGLLLETWDMDFGLKMFHIAIILLFLSFSIQGVPKSTTEAASYPSFLLGRPVSSQMTWLLVLDRSQWP